jgi:transcriptional regulator with XRE-family HTH domain
MNMYLVTRRNAMTDGKAIPVSILWEDYYENMHDAYDSMRSIIGKRRVTQDELAAKLDADKGLISKRIRGSKNLTLKTLSFMATALGCRLSIRFVPYEEVAAVEQRNTAGDSEFITSDADDVRLSRKLGIRTPTRDEDRAVWCTA